MSLGDALDTAFAHRITLPAGDQEHMGAPIADTAAAQLPDPTAGQPAEVGPGSMEQDGATQLPVDLGMMVAGADISGLPEADMAKAAAAAVAASGAPSGEDPAQAALDAVFGGDTSRQGSLQQQQEQERQRQGEAVKQDTEADFLASILADPEEKKESDAATAQLSQCSEASGQQHLVAQMLACTMIVRQRQPSRRSGGRLQMKHCCWLRMFERSASVARGRNAVCRPAYSCGTCLARKHMHSQICVSAPAHPFSMGHTLQALPWLCSNTL